MATTVTAELTPTTDTTPAVADVPAKEKSGAKWVAKFPGSASLDDLEPAFKANATAAAAMVKGYGIVFPPALISRHTEKVAVEMTIGGMVDRKSKMLLTKKWTSKN